MPTRRQVTLGLAAALGAAGSASSLRAAETRSVTTSLGTYDIPARPQRVVAIDFRLDAELALALGLDVVGYGVQAERLEWIPLPAAASFVGGPPDREAIAALDPDLIVCTDIPGSDYWPIDRLDGIAPVLPVDYELNWQANLVRMGEWLGRQDAAAAFIGQYQQGLDAVKAARGAALAEKRVAAIWYEPDSSEVQLLLGEGTTNGSLAGQVLADLGGTTVSPDQLGEYAVISMERAPEILGALDGFVLDADDPARLAALEAHPIWQRLPAVAAGHVVHATGTFYGGGYSARHVIPAWDALYALLG